jgi:hypothetical protein
MTKIAELLGRVMMTAVSLPRSHTNDITTLARTEYRKGDQDYIKYCLQNDRPLDIR